MKKRITELKNKFTFSEEDFDDDEFHQAEATIAFSDFCKSAAKKNETSDPHYEAVEGVRYYKLITPMVGGGIDPYTNDPSDVQKCLRVSQIRGMIRYWFRALHLKTLNSVEEVYKKESKIFGGGNNEMASSLFSLEVKEFSFEKLKSANNPFENNNHNQDIFYSYGFFPKFMEMRQRYKGRKSTVKQEVLKEFNELFIGEKESFFTLSFAISEELSKDEYIMLSRAIHGWEMFGGIGARSRRGFGAFVRVQSNENKTAYYTKERFIQLLNLLCGDEQVSRIPESGPFLNSIEDIRLVKVPKNQSFGYFALSILKSFRQGKVIGSDVTDWPDANRILEYIENVISNNAQQDTIYEIRKQLLGLPISYQKLGSKYINERFKITAELQERLSSPLIIRPLEFREERYVLFLMLSRRVKKDAPGASLKISISKKKNSNGRLSIGNERDKSFESKLNGYLKNPGYSIKPKTSAHNLENKFFNMKACFFTYLDEQRKSEELKIDKKL
jgi:CRISPR-associated protein Cmr1